MGISQNQFYQNPSVIATNDRVADLEKENHRLKYLLEQGQDITNKDRDQYGAIENDNFMRNAIQ